MTSYKKKSHIAPHIHIALLAQIYIYQNIALRLHFDHLKSARDDDISMKISPSACNDDISKKILK